MNYYATDILLKRKPKYLIRRGYNFETETNVSNTFATDICFTTDRLAPIIIDDFVPVFECPKCNVMYAKYTLHRCPYKSRRLLVFGKYTDCHSACKYWNCLEHVKQTKSFCSRECKLLHETDPPPFPKDDPETVKPVKVKIPPKIRRFCTLCKVRKIRDYPSHLHRRWHIYCSTCRQKQ